jgi:hypothetical protein
MKCVWAGRKCEGYILLKPLLFEIAEDEDERRAFHYYRNRTSKQLISFQQHRFWNDIVIRAAYFKPAIRHMLAAIAAFQESADCEDDLRRLDRNTFCQDQYHKSISLTLKLPPDVADILVLAILFAFLESVNGSLTNAHAHLRSCMRIITEWNSQDWQPGSTTDLVTKHLAPIIERMYVKTAAAWIILPSNVDDPLSSMPMKLCSLKACRDTFFQTTSEISRQLSQALEHLSWPQCNNKTVASCEKLIGLWSNLFVDHILNGEKTCRCSRVNHDWFGLHWLQMNYQLVVIRLRSKTVRSEMTYDAYIPEFAELLRCLEEYMAKLKHIDRSELEACLGFEANYLKITAMIIFHCRDPQIRRRTLELVRTTSRHEGIWTNSTAADMSELLIRTEEERAGHPVSTCADIPEKARVIVLSLGFNSYNPVTRMFES